MIYTVTLNPAVDREVLVQDIQYDTVLRAQSSQIDIGGKGFNVSRMLHALGVNSCALGFVGGKSGEILQEGLKSLGIQSEFVWIEGETRTNISIVTPNHDHYLKINEPGPEISSDRQRDLLDRMRILIKKDDWWVLAGSLPPGVPDTMYNEMIRMIESSGAHTILDSSGKAFEFGCRASAFLVKPNCIEAEKLTGISIHTSKDAVKAAKYIQEMGVPNVVISLGKNGAILTCQQESWLVSSPEIQECNPIGAGDSLVGGLVFAISSGKTMRDALCWGVACGAASASRYGTTVGDRELVEKLLNQVSAEKIYSPTGKEV